MGTTPEQLESNGSEVLNNNQDPLIKDISEYLLLHHNYSAKPPKEKTKARRTRTREIRPKQNELASDILLGTFDENTNCITIVVNDENCEDIINEDVVQDESRLSVETSFGSASPHSSSSSDCGYESFGSPESLGETNELWNHEVSELFPSLL